MARQREGERDPLLILIDGLDEAADPEAAVQGVPKVGLPRGVFVVASSRPSASSIDFLAPLLDAGARRFVLDGHDADNLRDVGDYFRQELGPELSQGQAAALAVATGGIFQLAFSVREEIGHGHLGIVEAIELGDQRVDLSQSDQIFAWYARSWGRMIRGLSADELDSLREFLALMVAAQAPIAEAQVLGILGWHSRDLARALDRSRWFLSRHHSERGGYEEMYLQLRHQSIHDFLVSPLRGGPLRLDHRQMHRRIAEYYLTRARSDGWGPSSRMAATSSSGTSSARARSRTGTRRNSA